MRADHAGQHHLGLGRLQNARLHDIGGDMRRHVDAWAGRETLTLTGCTENSSTSEIGSERGIEEKRTREGNM